MRSVQKVSSHVLWKIETFIEEDTIQETLYIGQWCLSSLQSRRLGTSHSSSRISSTVQNTLQKPLLESPPVAPLYFPESHWQSEISSLSKAILVLVKARSCRAPNLGCSGDESPGWFDVSPKTSAGDVTHERVCCHNEPANHQLPIVAAFWII